MNITLLQWRIGSSLNSALHYITKTFLLELSKHKKDESCGYNCPFEMTRSLIVFVDAIGTFVVDMKVKKVCEDNYH